MKPQVAGDVQGLPLGAQIVTALQGRPVANTPPAPSQVMGWSLSNNQWTPAYPPGYEIGYNTITSNVNVTGTASNTATVIVQLIGLSFDGTPVMAKFFAPFVSLPTVAGASMFIGLFEGSTLIADVAYINAAASTSGSPGILELRFAPTSGTHSYSIKAWVSSTTGTPNINAGTGSGGVTPAFLRFTKA